MLKETTIYTHVLNRRGKTSESPAMRNALHNLESRGHLMFALKTFPCPNCHEFINSGMEKCKYCSITIDPQVANAAVELQDKINRSCNEASLIRNIAGTMWVGFFVRFVPFIGIVGLVIMVIGFIVVPPWLIYWQIKFGRIKTADMDYKRAKRNWLGALVLWLLLLIILVVLIVFVAGI